MMQHPSKHRRVAVVGAVSGDDNARDLPALQSLARFLLPWVLRRWGQNDAGIVCTAATAGIDDSTAGIAVAATAAAAASAAAADPAEARSYLVG